MMYVICSFFYSVEPLTFQGFSNNGSISLHTWSFSFLFCITSRKTQYTCFKILLRKGNCQTSSHRYIYLSRINTTCMTCMGFQGPFIPKSFTNTIIILKQLQDVMSRYFPFYLTFLKHDSTDFSMALGIDFLVQQIYCCKP